jgi:hypothetical protein
MAENIESEDVPSAEEAEVETPEAELQEDTDWKAEAIKARRIAARYRNQAIKAKEAKVEPTTPEPSKKPEDTTLLQKSYLRAAGITHAEDVELALKTAKKWGIEVDELVDDDDFKSKLEKQQTARANASATSRISGSPGTQSATKTPAYWLAKGTPPTAEDIPDRKERAAIVRAFMKGGGKGKTFYND